MLQVDQSPSKTLMPWGIITSRQDLQHQQLHRQPLFPFQQYNLPNLNKRTANLRPNQQFGLIH
ncbi:hypothetical protein MKW92_035548 [Papaver armeniacum]|nr:hypothetical protein MKW92_035548 [Papaver armeniacum]